ncbi:MAG: ROK family protein [Candidatus Eremiobacteraeota bacterium]|nr:ROK family protein [Candidatus Eremiobacteraeota bacterium]
MRIGIDLGSTTIDVIALGSEGATLMAQRVPISGGDYEQVLTSIAALVKDAEDKAGEPGTVGIGTPGTISAKTGKLKNANSAYLIGRDLPTDVARRLGREVRLANDANCFALSEATDGAAAADRVVLGVILDAGVGAGLVIDKNIIHGANGIAGEFGHNPLPWAGTEEFLGARCYCGKFGCIESFLSGPALQRAYKIRSGRYININEIARAAAAREPEAIACLVEYEDRLARSLASVVNILDPDVIVLGGALSQIERNYRALHEAIAHYAITDRLDTRIVPALHGDTSGVRGAAMLWPA